MTFTLESRPESNLLLFLPVLRTELWVVSSLMHDSGDGGG